MITLSIFWALVFALFVTKTEQPNEDRQEIAKAVSRATDKNEWEFACARLPQ